MTRDEIDALPLRKVTNLRLCNLLVRETDRYPSLNVRTVGDLRRLLESDDCPTESGFLKRKSFGRASLVELHELICVFEIKARCLRDVFAARNALVAIQLPDALRYTMTALAAENGRSLDEEITHRLTMVSLGAKARKATKNRLERDKSEMKKVKQRRERLLQRGREIRAWMTKED